MPEPLLERLSGRVGRRADRLVPPRRLDFVGHADFVDRGDEFLGHLTELAGLKPDERVLDVACGTGWIARPLAAHLSGAGSYDGFDVNPDAVAWCTRRYRRHPNFRFQVADVFSRRHNPAATQSAGEFRFPYPDGSFHVVASCSVLTHLLEGEADHHLAEIARILAPGGRALLTFFLLDDASRAAIADGRAGLPFLDAEQPVAVVSDEAPEEAVAYDRAWLDAALARHGLRAADVHPGTWRGNDEGRSLQDLVLTARA